MNKNRIDTIPMSIHIFTFILLLFEILYKGVSSITIKEDFKTDNDSTHQNQILFQYYYRSRSNKTDIEMIQDDDPNYPYRKILQLVKDTKRILRSSNETEKNQLNLDPSIFTRYLRGDISDSVPYAGVPYPPTVDACPSKIEFREPQRLMGEDNREYYIINVGKELKQQYHAIICRHPRSKCNYSGLPGGYSFFCTTSFNRKRSFVSIPVGNKIRWSQQCMQSFNIPDNCICSRSRDEV